MLNGSITTTLPYISEEALRAALDALLYTHSQAQDGLLESLHMLACVQERVQSPDFPSMTDASTHIVQEILLDIITDELKTQRHSLGVTIPIDILRTRQQVIQDIRVDAATQNIGLRMWSYLFHRYLRADLGFSSDEFEDMFVCNARTLQRATKDGLIKLKLRLAAIEQKTRIRQKRHWLRAQLPISKPPGLIGRDQQLRSVLHTLQTTIRPHCLIHGPKGIGKTVFIHALAHELIDPNRSELMIEQIVYVDSPSSVRDVQHRIMSAHSNQDDNLDSISRRFLLLKYPALILIDTIDDLSPKELNNLLEHELQSVMVLMTSRTTPMLMSAFHIELPPLSRENVAALSRRLMPSDADEDLTPDDINDVMTASGGIPGMILPTIHRLASQSVGFVVMDGLEKRLNGLSEATLTALSVLIMSPHEGLTTNMVRSFLGDTYEYTISRLTAQNLIEVDNDHITLIWSVRPYLEQSLIENTSTRFASAFETVLETIGRKLADNSIDMQLQDAFVETLLWVLQGRLPVPLPIRSEWTTYLLQNNLTQSDLWLLILGRWLAETESVPTHRGGYFEIWLEASKQLRQHLHWTEAEQELNAIIDQFGQFGRFAQQHYAMLELAIQSRRRGSYKSAVALLQRIHNFANRTLDSTLSRGVTIELAQIDIDAHNYESAAERLADLEPDGRVLSLAAEIYLGLQKFDDASQLARRALPYYEDNLINTGRLYNLLGRIEFAMKTFKEATGHYDIAIRYLEFAGDVIGLARTQTNLAATLIMRRRFREARHLLITALQSQQQTQDVVGLVITERNLEILDDATDSDNS